MPPQLLINLALYYDPLKSKMSLFTLHTPPKHQVIYFICIENQGYIDIMLLLFKLYLSFHFFNNNKFL